MTNYSYNVGNTYGHGYPATNPLLIPPEATFLRDAISRAVWEIPASGTVTVIGYIVTKRFSVWLNTHGTAITGIDAAATVVYNTEIDTYTVTPLTTGGVDVVITQGGKTGISTNISTETVITVI